MPFYLAKLVFSGLHNFEENFFARYRMIRFKFRWQPPETLWLCSVAAKFIWTPRKLFFILMIPSHQQFISSQFYQKSLFYLQYSIDDNWSSLPFPQKTIRSSIILRTPPPRRKMMTSFQVSVIAIYTYTERKLSRQTRPCSLLSDHICR